MGGLREDSDTFMVAHTAGKPDVRTARNVIMYTELANAIPTAIACKYIWFVLGAIVCIRVSLRLCLFPTTMNISVMKILREVYSVISNTRVCSSLLLM